VTASNDGPSHSILTVFSAPCRRLRAFSRIEGPPRGDDGGLDRPLLSKFSLLRM